MVTDSAGAASDLHRAGAVVVEREGCQVVAHYGSAAAEIAVCSKAAGLVDRTGLHQLELMGSPDLLDRVIAVALPGPVPGAGSARCVAQTLCCRVAPERAIVVGAPAAVARWRQVTGRTMATSSQVTADLLSGSAAASVVGPRAGRVMNAAALPGDLLVEGVATGTLSGSDVTVVREDVDRFLLLFRDGCPDAAWQFLEAVGQPFGLALVGNDALERLQAARRPAAALEPS